MGMLISFSFRRRRVPFLLAATLLIATVARAEDPTVARWKNQLDESAAALTKGEHGRSLRIANGLIEDMVNRLGPGEGSTEIFGLALTHKALASAGLGRHDDALWHWHSVLSLYPAYANRDLSAYGSAGRFLMENRSVRSPSTSSFDPKKAAPGTMANATPPKLKKRVNPRYPAGAQHFGVGGLLVVEVIITPEGKVTAPVLVKTLPAPTLSYVALEAVRQWRFEPGRIDGVVKPVIFNLTLNYKP
jgi:TonB family protein